MRTSGALSLLLATLIATAGCAARGARGQALPACAAEDADAAPCEQIYTEPPRLLNERALQEVLEANYPAQLRD